MFLRLPLHGFIKDIPVGSILGRESVVAILHAEHYKRFGAVVAHAASSVRSHADYRAFLYREHITVNLKFSFA